MKLGQLIECNMRKIFLENHTQNLGERLVPDLFLKNGNWAYFWINSLRFYAVCFYFTPTKELLKYIENKLQTTCFHLILCFFKNKKRSGTSLSASFFTSCLRKNIPLFQSINWPGFIAWLPLLPEILGNMCIAMIC